MGWDLGTKEVDMHKRWLNIYPTDGATVLHESLEAANAAHNGKRVACVEIKFSEPPHHMAHVRRVDGQNLPGGAVATKYT